MILSRASRFALLLLILVGSCDDGPVDDRDPFIISGRLTSDFGCYLLRDGRSYELHNWEDPIPPLGSTVTVRVQPSLAAGSICMAGRMVDVLDVLDVCTDFRTAPVNEDETWSREDDIVLGDVEVARGATLRVLPGTVIKIIPEGRLNVRGRVLMEGAPYDSVRIEGILSPEGTAWRAGSVSCDSVAAGSRVRYVSTRSTIRISGEAPVLEAVQGTIAIVRGTATIRDCALSGVSADNATVVIENSVLGDVNGVFATFTLEGNALSDLLLSYSDATVTRNIFRGMQSTIIFHGPSNGTFERNTFEADTTLIEVRHDSEPLFQQNNLTSRSLTIRCNTYSGPPCIQFPNNWWGTADEELIRASFSGACEFCYTPWLTEPVVW